MASKLAGKVAIVTGASSGIGQSIAIRLGAEGADVVIDYVGHPEGADATRSTIEAGGGKAITVEANVAQLADTQSLVDQAWGRLGRCDILVNNAGIEKEAPFWDVTEADYDAVRVFPHSGLRPQAARRKTARPRHQHQLRPRGHGIPQLHLLLRL